MELNEISFDESDKNLFQVDEPRLRADALKHSILPRLHVILNECISTIKQVYDVEALDDSLISNYPNFRPTRENELSILYESAYVGLAGKRVKEKWFGVERKDKKPVQILPFRWGIQITQDGMGLLFDTYWLKGLTDDSYKKYLDFHMKYEGLIHSLCYLCRMKPEFYFYDIPGVKPISTVNQYYQQMIDNCIFDNNFISQDLRTYPISSEFLRSIIIRYTFFYPIYDAYICISKNLPVRFLELIEKANSWLLKEDLEDENQLIKPVYSQESLLKIRELAEKKVKVMPAIRWQVFKRDNWKCVACGRGSENNAILHVDHIIPRSKGGENNLKNYQTLCDSCNIGKSNNDNTDLRSRLSDGNAH